MASSEHAEVGSNLDQLGGAGAAVAAISTRPGAVERLADRGCDGAGDQLGPERAARVLDVAQEPLAELSDDRRGGRVASSEHAARWLAVDVAQELGQLAEGGSNLDQLGGAGAAVELGSLGRRDDLELLRRPREDARAAIDAS